MRAAVEEPVLSLSKEPAECSHHHSSSIRSTTTAVPGSLNSTRRCENVQSIGKTVRKIYNYRLQCRSFDYGSHKAASLRSG